MPELSVSLTPSFGFGPDFRDDRFSGWRQAHRPLPFRRATARGAWRRLHALTATNPEELDSDSEEEGDGSAPEEEEGGGAPAATSPMEVRGAMAAAVVVRRYNGCARVCRPATNRVKFMELFFSPGVGKPITCLLAHLSSWSQELFLIFY